MTYNKNYIIDHILKFIDFKEIEFDTFNSDITDSIAEKFPLGYQVKCGASKLVIIPPNSDYIIKIPFTFSIDSSSDVGSSSYWSSSCAPGGEPFDCAYYPIEKEFGWNYCKVEEELYFLSTQEKVNDFFAETVYLGNIYDFPIYVQEKCNIIYGETHFAPEHSKEERQRTTEKINEWGSFKNISLDFTIDMIQHYGEIKVKQLFNFIKKYEISDLHRNNYGYCGDRPVLIDYSGFAD